MLRHQIVSEQKILIVEPLDDLEASDFTTVASEIDPWIEEHGPLRGVLIDAPEFPGWDDFAALVEHLRFVREHHREVERVAVVSDDRFLEIAPKIASWFVAAEVRHFDADQRDAALAWLSRTDRPS